DSACVSRSTWGSAVQAQGADSGVRSDDRDLAPIAGNEQTARCDPRCRPSASHGPGRRQDSNNQTKLHAVRSLIRGVMRSKSDERGMRVVFELAETQQAPRYQGNYCE